MLTIFLSFLFFLFSLIFANWHILSSFWLGLVLIFCFNEIVFKKKSKVFLFLIITLSFFYDAYSDIFIGSTLLFLIFGFDFLVLCLTITRNQLIYIKAKPTISFGLFFIGFIIIKLIIFKIFYESNPSFDDFIFLILTLVSYLIIKKTKIINYIYKIRHV